MAIFRFGAAGDVLLCAPAIRLMAQVYPDARLIFVTHARHARLVEGWPELGAVIALGSDGVGGLIRRLRAMKIDAVLDLHATCRSRWVGRRLKTSRRAVWCKRYVDEQWAVRLGGAPYRPRMRQAQRYHRAVEAFVGRCLEEPQLIHTPHPTHVAEGAQAFLSLNLPADGVPLVVLHPGANWATKRYPKEHYAELAQKLDAQGLRVLALGSDKERPMLEAIQQACPSLLLLKQAVSLAGLAGLLRHAHVFVVGDTGPMHLARGLGIPCVILFGSTPATAFDVEGHVVCTSDLHCAPCSFYGRAHCPRGHMRCLYDLSADTVLMGIKTLLARYGTHASSLKRVQTWG